jgi:hypothetical protein
MALAQLPPPAPKKAFDKSPAVCHLRFPCDFSQRRTLVDGDVIGLVALDEILRLGFGGMPLVSLEGDLGSNLLLNHAGNASGFRVPRYAVACFKTPGHDDPRAGKDRNENILLHAMPNGLD